MGSPYYLLREYQVEVSFDAGRHGQTCVKLFFKTSKRTLGTTLAKFGDDDNLVSYYEATFKTGVQIDGAYQIQEFSASPASQLPKDHGCWDDVIEESLDEKGVSLFRQQNLAVISFLSHGCQLSPFRSSSVRHLPSNVQQAMDFLFTRTGSFWVTIYVATMPNFDKARSNWLEHLDFFINIQKPQLHPYLDEEGRPDLRLGMDTIKGFANGMLLTYPAQRDSKGQVVKKDDGAPKEDRSQDPIYYNYPRLCNWDEARSFHIYTAMPVIRDFQFEVGQIQHISMMPHYGCYQLYPRFNMNVGKAGQEYKDLYNAVKVWVGYNPKMDRAFRALKPPHGTQVKMFVNRKYHDIPLANDEDVCWGTVIDGGAGLLTTRTDFCVHLSRFGLANLPTQSLPIVHIIPIINEQPAQRALIAVRQLADPDFEPERLGPIKNDLMQEPSRLPGVTINITRTNPEVWDKWYEVCRQRFGKNEDQMAVIDLMKAIPNNLGAVVGPPGTGKTDVLVHGTIGSGLQGLKTLVAAVANKAVDKSANAVWDAFPLERRNDFRFLRLETSATEMRALLRVQNVFDSEKADPNSRPVLEKKKGLADDPAVWEAISQAGVSMIESSIEMDKLLQRWEDWETALEVYRNLRGTRVSEVPLDMTLSYHTWLLIHQDEEDAHNTYEDIEAAWLAPKKNRGDNRTGPACI